MMYTYSKIARFAAVLLALVGYILYVEEYVNAYIDYDLSYHVKLWKTKVWGPSSVFCSPSASHARQVLPSNNNTPPPSWNSVVEDYLRDSQNTKFVVYRPHPHQGMCNRMLHSISSLMFAMATHRKLWIDWPEVPSHSFEAVEQIGMSSYESLFSKTRGANAWPTNTTTVVESDEVDSCMAYRLRFEDVRQFKQDEPVISIASGDFWGSLLILNPHIATFRGLDINEGVPILFKTLFFPLAPLPPPIQKCSWVFQYRCQWPKPYVTTSFDRYIECAQAHGFTKRDAQTSWIITDNPATLIRSSSLATKSTFLSKMNFIEKSKPCRGPCGDNETLRHMYALSSCKNAVLTHSSSFGVCIVGLANIENAVKVTRFGECIKPKHKMIDPNLQSKYGGERTLLHEI